VPFRRHGVILDVSASLLAILNLHLSLSLSLSLPQTHSSPTIHTLGFLLLFFILSFSSLPRKFIQTARDFFCLFGSFNFYVRRRRSEKKRLKKKKKTGAKEISFSSLINENSRWMKEKRK